MKNPIPEEWLSVPRQKRIICHWTVGSYTPSEDCLSSYHILVGYKDGKAYLIRGDDDLDTPTPHTYMFNSSIGLSICSLGGYQSTSNPGPYPIKKEQWELLVESVAQLCKAFDIPITPTDVLMHGEVTDRLGVDQWGKWDIGWLPHLGLNGADECGNHLRHEVMKLLDGKQELPEVEVTVGNTTIKGLVYDGSTIVPLRSFVESLNGLGLDLEIKQSMLKWHLLVQGKVSPDTFVTHTFKYMLLSGDKRGWVSLRELADKLKLTLTISVWAKSSKKIKITIS